ncbi:MAG TPA: hypothetical protein VLA06_07500 [Woeseiaceae bacterium]|nr:hypothetical protein [Woeseiaceae bacterium]
MSKEPTNKDPFADRTRELFHESVDRLDGATLSRLNQGRQRALAELDRAAPHGQWLRWVPVTGVAVAALVAVMVVNQPGQVDEPMTPTDFEMLIEHEELELLEDLEFYTWLELADAEASGDVG